MYIFTCIYFKLYDYLLKCILISKGTLYFCYNKLLLRNALQFHIILNKYVGELKENASVMMCRKLGELIP